MSEEVVPRKGQIGTIFTATIEEPNPNFDDSQPEGPTNKKFLVVDLTNATGQNEIDFRRPNETTFKRNAIRVAPFTDGKIQYIDSASPGVLDMSGLWRIRGLVKFADGSEFPGSFTEMRVGK